MAAFETSIIVGINSTASLSVVAWSSIALGVACATAIVIDIAMGRRQHMAIMNFVWPLTALYAGPFSLAAYCAFGRAKPRMEHPPHDHASHHRRPMWQSALIGTTHCGAGCMLGDVVAESSLYLLGEMALLGSALLTSFIIDFAAAYLFGMIFQYFSIVPMRHLSPAQGILAAVKADTLSLIAFQVGMYAWMAITQKLIFDPALKPNSPVFWFMMQIAMIAGFITSYPMNWVLVQSGIKEAM